MSTTARILIVDDEPLNVDYLEQELEDLGYETVSAFDGEEALEKVAAESPDLILLDVMMPKLDGFEVCRILKESDDTRLIPVIIMTALSSTEERIKGIEAGADDFLTKPVDDRELQARMKTALKLKAAVDGRMHQLGQVRDHFAKFVPEAVKKRVATNPCAPDLEKRYEDVSVLFLDIVGYTRLSEKLSAEALNSLVESYFSAFLDRIHDAGGDICESSGDGLMVIFQDPEPRAHAVAAAETALALFAITRQLNAARDEHPLSLHMGINSGSAAVGSTRYEGARGSRWVFTADGLVPNLAARLAGIAEADDLFVSPETADRLDGGYGVRLIGSRELKNIAEPVDIYGVHVPGAE